MTVVARVALTLLTVFALSACFKDSPAAPQDAVAIQSDFGTKIVYATANPSIDLEPLRAHCSRLKGTFNTCGSPCAPDAQGCITVCALTCENVPAR